jgi:urease accessory protein
MGTSADRVTAADFLTPPEFRDLHLAADGAGRIGGVRCELGHGSRGTVPSRLYQQVPLRVLPPFHFGAEQPALLYLLNPTAGLLDGDGQLVEVAASPGVRVVLVGQSATRIHPCLHGFATQQWRLSVAAAAVVVVLPGPALPFQGCRYFQSVVIDLALGAGLVWGDVWLAGRYSRGAGSERFQFATMVQELTVRREGTLVYRDRFCWHGPWDAATAAWHFGPGPACASLFVAGSAVRDLPTENAARFETASGDVCLRWLGDAEAVIAAMVRTALRAGAGLAGAREPVPWLLATDALAPNHWFSVPHQPARL